MYRALAHQCNLHEQPQLVDGADTLSAHTVLRKKAAAHVKAHATEFEPFIVDTDKEQSADEQMQAFLLGVMGIEWGTQVELQALAAELCVHIQVRIWQALACLEHADQVSLAPVCANAAIKRAARIDACDTKRVIASKHKRKYAAAGTVVAALQSID